MGRVLGSKMKLKAAGFTLIELLIATVILLALLSLSMFSYSTLTKAWGHRLSNIEFVQDDYKKKILFTNAVSGIIPVVTRQRNDTGFYFLGDSSGFTAITNSAIFNPDYPAVIRVFSERSESGTFDLVYEEASLKDLLLLDSGQELPFANKLLIFSDLSRIDFAYYALPDISTPVEFDRFEQPKERRQWLGNHDGMVARTHPTDFSINIDGFEMLFSVADRAGVLTSRIGGSE